MAVKWARRIIAAGCTFAAIGLARPAGANAWPMITAATGTSARPATRTTTARDAALPAAGTTTAYYLVFEARDDDGSVAAVSSTIVQLRGPLPSLSATEVHRRLAVTTRATDVVAVTLEDAAGRTVYRSTVTVPKWLRGEFRRDVPGTKGTPGESNIDAHLVALRPRSFVVRAPLVPGATLSLQSSLLARPASFELDALAAGPDLAPRGAAADHVDTLAANPDLARRSAAAAVQALPGSSSGDPANRVDLLLVADGYTAAEQAQFESDALGLANDFFQITPYHEYRNYLNVSALFVPSAESGGDHPPYDPSCGEFQRAQTCCGDPAAQGEDGVFVDTAFDAAYCSFNVQRLLTVDTSKVLAAAAAAPDWDEIAVIVNDATYGGSGGALAVLSTHAAAVEIAQHEYGHSFTRLADEYETPFAGYPPCSDVTGTLPACERNVTDETERALVKWQRWIAAAMPIPSLDPPPADTDGGLWQGARYLSTMYRQGYDCTMRSLGRPFGDVASEAYALRLYEGTEAATRIDNVEPGSESPPPGAVTVPAGSVPFFAAQVLGPIDGPDLTVNWYVDGGLVSASRAPTDTKVDLAFDRPPGQYTLALEVIDESPIIHPAQRAALASTRIWSITVPCDPTSDTDCPSPTPTATEISTPSPTASETPMPPTATAEAPTPSPSETPTPVTTPLAACGASPQASCRVPAVAKRAALQLKNGRADDRDRLLWSWLKGTATTASAFGDPPSTTSYRLCVYDAAPQLILTAFAPAGGLCGSKKPRPCWRATRKGFQYRDAQGIANGLRNIVLQQGLKDGHAKIIVSGKGARLGLPVLPVGRLPLSVQLVSSSGECWEATYSSPLKNGLQEFRAKAD